MHAALQASREEFPSTMNSSLVFYIQYTGIRNFLQFSQAKVHENVARIEAISIVWMRLSTASLSQK
jgi:hypothetical protein